MRNTHVGGRARASRDPVAPTVRASRIACVAATGLLGAVSFAGIAAASGFPTAGGIPTCFGKPATIVVTQNGAHVTGTRGNDVIVVTAPKGAWVDGGSGDDLICGGPGNDQLFGGAGNDHLDGGGGANLLEGGYGLDHLTVHPKDTVANSNGDYANGKPVSQLSSPSPSPSKSASASPSPSTAVPQLLPALDLIDVPPPTAGSVASPVDVPAPQVAGDAPDVAACATPAAGTPTAKTYDGQGGWAAVPPAPDAPAVELHLPAAAIAPGPTSIGVAIGGVVGGAKLTLASVTAWQVDFGDGSVRSGTGPLGALRHVYKTAGVVPVTLRVQFGTIRAEDTATLEISGTATTANVTPQPTFGAASVPVYRGVPTLLDLTKSFPGAGQTLAGGTIDFGDCSTPVTLSGDPSLWSASHVYATDGVKTVTVTVTDGTGTTSTATTNLDVAEPPAPVTVVPSATASVVAPSGAPTGDFGPTASPSAAATAPVTPVAPTPQAALGWN